MNRQSLTEAVESGKTRGIIRMGQVGQDFVNMTLRDPDPVPSELLGSVSHGTMVSSDLIESFSPILRQYNPAAFAAMESDLAILEKSLEDTGYGMRYNSEKSRELASMVLNEDMFNAMQEIAPQGFYFGSHPGDGSDYGFWQVDPEDMFD